MLSRTRVAAVALAVVSSAVLIGGIAEASSPGLTAPETMVVTVRGGTSSFINNAGSPNGFDPGDMLILTQPAYRGTGTTRIGTGFVTLVATGADSAQLHASLKLNGGDIELGGDPAPRRRAVHAGRHRRNGGVPERPWPGDGQRRPGQRESGPGQDHADPAAVGSADGGCGWCRTPRPTAPSRAPRE